MDSSVLSFIHKISVSFLALTLCINSFGQHHKTVIYNKLIEIEDNALLSYQQKLPKVQTLKKQFDDHKLSPDSVYARILHRIGLFEYFINDEVATKDAIRLTHAAIKINSGGETDNAPELCVKSYNNLGTYYHSLGMYDAAAEAYDSAIMLRRKYDVPDIFETKLLLKRGEMLFDTGDYQKASEEYSIAIPLAGAAKDTATVLSLLNQRAEAYLRQDRLDEAWRDLNAAGNLSTLYDFNIEAINNIVVKADYLVKIKDYSKALILYKNAIEAKLGTNEYGRIANDYIKLGNVYMVYMNDHAKANESYAKAFSHAQMAQDPELISKAHLNLGRVSTSLQNFKEAETFIIQALDDIQVKHSNSILVNPSITQLSSSGYTELILYILENKSELLLKQFKQTKDRNYLAACLRTNLLMDTLITKIRHEQSGLQSKVFWRSWSRDFFTIAIEACYLARDDKHAFYFMEKSRAVLLNDRLNESEASVHLPIREAMKERELKMDIILEEQKLVPEKNKNDYEAQQLRLLQAKANLERYVKSLESRYPSYYQYKYADEIPSLNALQQRLLKDKQSFVHYFIEDTLAYILATSPAKTKMIRVSKDIFDSRQLTLFMQLCSRKPKTTGQYASFASLSYSLYTLLFQPMNIPEGRVVICPDLYLIPFEAMCTDPAGNNFLIDKYVFSYVYSARYLMKQYKLYPAERNFVGFAPVSFKAYPNVPDLKLSGYALKQSSRHYSKPRLFTYDLATRRAFIDAVSGFTIVNVFSHARADTTDNEPMLYMFDSILHLSALQMIHKPATELVVLSACQTSSGKRAKGEGIFSLAREFSSIGIPSVAATLWNADEQAIYAISGRFHEYLSQGLPKDEALQRAKLDFIKKGGTAKPFPSYWANMILIGNTEAVSLSENHQLWWIAGAILLTAVVLLIIFKRRPV